MFYNYLYYHNNTNWNKMSDKRVYLNLFLIMLIGLLIRLMSIDKPFGLWNDEYVSWYISQKPLIGEFFDAVYKNCHMPFYYFYLKCWTAIFGNQDLALRVSSVFPSILGVMTMFFVGKKLKDSHTGLVCAILTAFSGFMIYFAQEVRFYSILFLFSAFAILVTLKLLEKQSYTNYLLFYISNVLVMFTHTIGFVFVFFNFLTVFYFLKKEEKISVKQITLIVLSTAVTMLPLFPFLYKTLTASYLSQFWSDFSLTKLFFVFADYISPIQINIVNTPSSLLSFLSKNGHLNYGYFIFAIIPMIIAFVSIVKALKKLDKNLKAISLIALGTLVVMVIASLLGKMVLITKYTTEIYPIFIALVAVGLCSISPMFLQKTLSVLLFAPIVFYTVFSDYAPQKINRLEGHKAVAKLIQDANLKKGDSILLLYYEDYRFEKYVKMEDFFVESVTKFNFQYRLMHEPPLHSTIMADGKNMFKESFSSGECKFFDGYLHKFFFNRMKKGEKFALISLKSVAFVDEEKMTQTLENPQKYEKIPFMFLIFSHVDNLSHKYANAALKPVFKEDVGSWEISVWEKI